MKKTTFEVKHNYQYDYDYVIKIEDEATKNHRETDQPVLTNFMPENKTDTMCPVRSFKMYIEHLNPKNPFLWQTPNPNITNEEATKVWYTRQHIGKNTLGSFMSELSKNVKLSRRYTNHSIRVTGASILTRCNFNDKEVMSMTGHKSVQSLTIYQRVQDKTKVKTGKVLQKSLTSDDDTLLKSIEAPAPRQNQPKQIPNSPAKALEPAPAHPQIQPEKAIVPYEPNFDDEDLDGIDWLKILCDAENANKDVAVPTHSDTSVSTTLVQQRNSPMFANCRIGNINININKK